MSAIARIGHVALHDLPIGGRAQGLGVWNWVRLPFQAALIAWAWLYTRYAGPAAVRSEEAA